MIIISLTDIIDLNHKLEEKEIAARVHLRDTCGRQSMWVEITEECGFDGKEEAAKDIIKNYFMEKGAEIKFLEKGLEFILV